MRGTPDLITQTEAPGKGPTTCNTGRSSTKRPLLGFALQYHMGPVRIVGSTTRLDGTLSRLVELTCTCLHTQVAAVLPSHALASAVARIDCVLFGSYTKNNYGRTG